MGRCPNMDHTNATVTIAAPPSSASQKEGGVITVQTAAGDVKIEAKAEAKVTTVYDWQADLKK